MKQHMENPAGRPQDLFSVPDQQLLKQLADSLYQAAFSAHSADQPQQPEPPALATLSSSLSAGMEPGLDGKLQPEWLMPAVQSPLDPAILTKIANSLYRDAPSLPYREPLPDSFADNYPPQPDLRQAMPEQTPWLPDDRRDMLKDPPDAATEAKSHEPYPWERHAESGYYFLQQENKPNRRTEIMERDWSEYRMFNPEYIRKDFPVLQHTVNGKPLVWLDNAATTQKPQSVIDTISRYYERDNSNIHRGAHTLAARATDAYEEAREKIRRFIGAPAKEQIIFVRGTTEGINLVAGTFGRQGIGFGDEIILTELEHHANIVPWQMLAREKGAKLRVAPINERGDILLEEYEKLFGPRTRMVAIGHVSNALGTVLPAKDMIAIAHRHGVPVLLDGAQSVQHMQVDVQELDCDFFVFSGHKLFAPTGIGAVYGKMQHLERMPPWQGGGNMIETVHFEETTYSGVPAKFEAGTPNIADAIGLGAAIDYVLKIGMENIHRYEAELMEYLLESLRTIPGLRLIGNPKERAGAVSLILKDIPNSLVGRLLNQEGIAVRTGHHCAQPSLRHFGLDSSVRPSLAFYNTRDDVDRLREALRRMVQ